jgi:hypothetical protein
MSATEPPGAINEVIRKLDVRNSNIRAEGSNGGMAGAQEDAETDDASRASNLAAALAATGPRLVFLRGFAGA